MENGKVSKRCGVWYYGLVGCDAVYFGIKAQSTQKPVYQTSHYRRKCLAAFSISTPNCIFGQENYTLPSVNNLLLKQHSVREHNSYLLTQNGLLLQRSMKREMSDFKSRMKQRLQEESRKHRMELYMLKVRFATHTENTHNSTLFIPPWMSYHESPYTNSHYHKLSRILVVRILITLHLN